MKTIVIDDFFKDYDRMLELAYKQKYYKREEHPEQREREAKWPGFRTDWLRKTDEGLYWSIVYQIQDHFDIQNNIPTQFAHVFRKRDYQINAYYHYKTEATEKDDGVHVDAGDYSLIVYMGPTNLKSGTVIVDDYDNPITDVKFVSNRAIMFDSQYRHKGYGAFGDSLQNGRLTLNAMLEFIDPQGAI